MTQSVLNTFKKLNIGVKLWAFYLLKYGIRSFLKHDFISNIRNQKINGIFRVINFLPHNLRPNTLIYIYSKLIFDSKCIKYF